MIEKRSFSYVVDLRWSGFVVVGNCSIVFRSGYSTTDDKEEPYSADCSRVNRAVSDRALHMQALTEFRDAGKLCTDVNSSSKYMSPLLTM